MSGVQQLLHGGERTYIDISEFLAGTYGDRIALSDYGGSNYSYKDVDNLAGRIAFFLHSHGIKRGDRVSVLSPNKSMEVALLFACTKLGAVLVPHNLRLSEKELRYEFEISSAKIVVFSTSLEENLKHLLNEIPAEKIELEGLEKINGKKFGSTQLDLEDPVLILFTGGTTGEPKGALIPLRLVVFNALNTVLSWKLTGEDSTLLVYPLFHTGGWNVLTLPLLFVGGRVTLIEKFEPASLIKLIQETQTTIFSSVPSVLADMSSSDKFKEASFASVKFIKSGGGMTPKNVVTRYVEKGLKFYQGYGLTEAGPNIFYSSEGDMKKDLTIGRKSVMVDLKLVDEIGKEGDTGELWVRSPITFSGYVGKGQEGSTDKEGYIRTGDILRRDGDGNYFFKGRVKFMYKSGGENVYPGEVEAVLEKHPDIVEAAVIGVPDAKWGEVGKAFLVSRTKVSEEEIRNYSSNYLARYEIPKYFKFLDSIPRTSNGKKDYLELRGEKDD